MAEVDVASMIDGLTDGAAPEPAARRVKLYRVKPEVDSQPQGGMWYCTLYGDEAQDYEAHAQRVYKAGSYRARREEQQDDGEWEKLGEEEFSCGGGDPLDAAGDPLATARPPWQATKDYRGTFDLDGADQTRELRHRVRELEDRVASLRNELDTSEIERRRKAREVEDMTVRLARAEAESETLRKSQGTGKFNDMLEVAERLRPPDPPSRLEIIEELKAMKEFFGGSAGGEAPDGMGALANTMTEGFKLLDHHLNRQARLNLLAARAKGRARKGAAQNGSDKPREKPQIPEKGEVSIDELLEAMDDDAGHQQGPQDPQEVEVKGTLEEATTLAQVILVGLRDMPAPGEWVKAAGPKLTGPVAKALLKVNDEETLIEMLDSVEGLDLDTLTALISEKRMRRMYWINKAVPLLKRAVEQKIAKQRS